mmetsp:Transcript_12324/g.39679  ORF Transcript_12324/g.39679 Transcript_12324/m.39679 type:complete len:343 (+) Transcript_12324:429-1457(+)
MREARGAEEPGRPHRPDRPTPPGPAPGPALARRLSPSLAPSPPAGRPRHGWSLSSAALLLLRTRRLPEWRPVPLLARRASRRRHAAVAGQAGGTLLLLCAWRVRERKLPLLARRAAAAGGRRRPASFFRPGPVLLLRARRLPRWRRLPLLARRSSQQGQQPAADAAPPSTPRADSRARRRACLFDRRGVRRLRPAAPRPGHRLHCSGQPRVRGSAPPVGAARRARGLVPHTPHGLDRRAAAGGGPTAGRGAGRAAGPPAAAGCARWAEHQQGRRVAGAQGRDRLCHADRSRRASSPVEYALRILFLFRAGPLRPCLAGGGAYARRRRRPRRAAGRHRVDEAV